ncbi:MAG TPA: DNA repair protein RadC [Blastocatellia bacterium]|nr:DNA repair protein RadC [Blastocatellia bacterium]
MDEKPDKPHYLKHRERLRKRFLSAGPDALQDYELLELLLTFVMKQGDVKPAAKALIERFGSLPAVFDATQEELEGVEGVGQVSGILVRLVKELFAAYMAEAVKPKAALSSPEAVVDFARVKLAGLPHEAFMVIFVNVKNEVITHEIIHEGTVDRAVVYPRRIIERALAHRAVGLILVHNHPSGHPEPSAEDKVLTRSITEACRTMEIRVLDHLIVGKRGHFSFASNGLMPS